MTVNVCNINIVYMYLYRVTLLNPGQVIFITNPQSLSQQLARFGDKLLPFGDLGTVLPVWGLSPKIGDSWHLCDGLAKEDD